MRAFQISPGEHTHIQMKRKRKSISHRRQSFVSDCLLLARNDRIMGGDDQIFNGRNVKMAQSTRFDPRTMRCVRCETEFGTQNFDSDGEHMVHLISSDSLASSVDSTSHCSPDSAKESNETVLCHKHRTTVPFRGKCTRLAAPHVRHSHRRKCSLDFCGAFCRLELLVSAEQK